MNEDEHRIHEMKERRNDKAASYEKPQVVRRKGWKKPDQCPRCKPFPINQICDLCKKIEESDAMSRK